MVDEKDNRLPSVMREIIKNSDHYIEQMLVYDLIRRNHLETYLRNNLRQIQSCLNKNKDKFINTNEYTQAKMLFQEKETEYQSWTEKFGNQVRVKEEKLKLLEKAAEENRKKQEQKEQEKEKLQQNEWNQKVLSNGTNQENTSKKKKKKDKRNKKGKGGRSTGGRGVVRKWVESHEPKTNTSMVSQSAWLTDEVSEKKKEKKKVTQGLDLTESVRQSLKNYNVNLEGKKEPFQHLTHSKKLPINPLSSDCFISNISFNYYDKETPQGGTKTVSSSNFILDNLDRLFTPEKQNLVFDLGEELRPENLLPSPDDLPIESEDFLFPVHLDQSVDGMFMLDFPVHNTLKAFFSDKMMSNEINTIAIKNFLNNLAQDCSESTMSWILMNAQDDHVDIIVEFLVKLNTQNPACLKWALTDLCTRDPVRVFNVHVLFKLKKHEIDVPPELMNEFVGTWFRYCNQSLQGEEQKHQMSKKKILGAVMTNTISNKSYDLGLLCREVDEFCSQNESLGCVRKMKQVIDERQKSQNKRRK